ncbi:MAG TPA: N-6 DNA methylase [Nanoarchaeota archaeon]|nr:N-6 DNA methylase [Nanoarchaeota archaeon]HIH62731.1 N-6 DNA methylase [Nanoarchaeota archaeon]HIJ09936.1 N-6 DNA methylase [Nanoarchaeota archaeon]
MELKEIISNLGIENGVYNKDDLKKIANPRLIKSIEKGKIDFDKIYFMDKRPLIIFKHFNIEVNEEEIKYILEKIWSLDEVPLFFVITPKLVRIYNSFFFDKDNPKKIEEKIENINSFLEEFKYEKLLGGDFLNKNELGFSKKRRLGEYLKDNLSVLIDKLESDGLEREIINNLLLKCFFSKCFIDRYDYFLKKIKNDYKVNSFEELILNIDDLYNFFGELKEKHNGDIFKTEKEEKNKIKKSSLKIISNFYKGYDLSRNQSVLFNPYNFSIIPVSLVSDIYQVVLGEEGREKNKSFYTPLFLVDEFLNKYKDSVSDKTTILDPSCGSGIFLVEFLRLKLSRLKKFDKSSIEKVLHTIYGFDLDKKAVKIACFSLYVVILDYIENLKSFKFDNLIDKNLFEIDFFDLTKFEESNQIPSSFDLIIGNPPWGQPAEQKRYKEYCKKRNFPITDGQIAEAFLYRAGEFSKDNHPISLLITSKIFYKNRDSFRKKFSEIFSIEEIIDFTRVRKLIFDEADSPFALMTYSRTKKKQKINFIPIKKSIFLERIKQLYFDKEEEKNLSHEHFVKGLKIYLDGNANDNRIIDKIREDSISLKTFLEEKNLDWGTGLIYNNKNIANNTSHFKDQNILNCKFLEGANKEFEKFNLNYDGLPKLKERFDIFQRLGNIESYKKPKILIRRGVSEIISTYEKRPCVYNNSIFGLCSKSTDQEDYLLFLGGLITSKLYLYYTFLLSNGVGVERAEITKADHLEFCIPKTLNLKLKSGKNIIKSYKELILSKGRNSNARKVLDSNVFELYGLSKIDEYFVEYVYDLIIPYWENPDKDENVFNSQKKLLREDDGEQYLKEYINLFFNSILFSTKIGKLNAEIYESPGFVCINFNYNKKGGEINKVKSSDNLSKLISNLGNLLSLDKVGERLFLQKELVGCSKNSIFIIKQNKKKYWHKKNAISDISEIIKLIKG